MASSTAFFDSPLGWLAVRCVDGALISVDFLNAAPASLPQTDSPCLQQAQAWLAAYFDRRPLPAMPPLAPARTAFQRRVREALQSIPSGETLSYGELARLMGTAPRAIGGALRANPLPLFVPCHRVVAVSGLGGYGGASEDGARRKRWLLDHERA